MRRFVLTIASAALLICGSLSTGEAQAFGGAGLFSNRPVLNFLGVHRRQARRAARRSARHGSFSATYSETYSSCPTCPQ